MPDTERTEWRVVYRDIAGRAPRYTTRDHPGAVSLLAKLTAHPAVTDAWIESRTVTPWRRHDDQQEPST